MLSGIQNYSVKLEIDPKRIIALWGFSEAAFGGILHALQIPLTGMFIGSAAVIFITLIAHYSKNRYSILQATITVIIIKAVISPHSPLAAYFAVALQGLLGYLFFSFIPFEKIAALLLGFFSLLFSALQKFILVTIVFGNTLWKSIDDFVNYILSQVNITLFDHSLSFSILLIGLYTLVHVGVGIYVGVKAPLLPSRLKNKSYLFTDTFKNYLTEDIFEKQKTRSHKRWWKRLTGIALIIFFVLLMILSYFSSDFQQNRAYEIFIMLIRSIVITFLWFVVLSPYVIKWFNGFIEKNKFTRASEINRVTGLFPEFRRIINYTWKASSHLKNFRRFRKFFSDSLVLLLITNIDVNE
ncbi:MAG: hypothetical protein RDU14_10845 [Melioribacteraceae bacterium]|nr:hypothetical protein [Melioribacteraceae bacterium]